MLWFEGSIADAIQKSKISRSLFIVYIYGEDDVSSQMNSTWESELVSGMCESTGAIAIRIKANSPDCTNFSQFYPVVVVPSTFFIGEVGVPLEVIGGQVSPDDFIAKFENVLKLHGEQKMKAQEANASGSGDVTPDGATAASVQDQAKPALPEEAKSSSQPLEDKVERAKLLMEQKRIEKEEKEKHKNRKAEEERRQMGHDLQKLKQQQQDTELKEIRDQMKKDKDLERVAKERVRQQIAKDREDRKVKFEKDKEDRNREKDDQKKMKLMEEQKKAEEQEARKSETARLQVRFPDGTSSSFSYPSGESLQTLMDDIEKTVHRPVRISTTFPKHTFTQEEMCMSFVDLRLAPSAVVIAVWDQGTGGTRSNVVSSGSSGIFSMLWTPFVWLWNFVLSLTLLFRGGNSPTNNQGQQQQAPTQQPQSDSQPRVSGSSRPERPKTAVRRRPDGNVRRMTDLRDDDDDMTTYNGNSTEQL